MNTALAIQEPCTELAQPNSQPFAIAIADMDEFAKLPEKRRVEVQVVLPILKRLHVAIPMEGKMAALRRIAALHRHQMRGLSWSSLQRKYDRYLVAGWRGLVKDYKAPSSQPEEFKQEIRRVAERNHKSIEEAFRQLRERWAKGEAIPGYGTWIEYYAQMYPTRAIPSTFPRSFYPHGWSHSNMRNYAPSKASRKLFQRGIAGSKKHFPSIIRTTEYLRPMELIVIDDFQLDCMCTFLGTEEYRPQIAYVGGLAALCVGTRKKLVHGVGPEVVREEKLPDGGTRTIRTKIRKADVQALIFQIFAQYGLPDYPVTILCENATASISPALEQAITSLFDGRVRIERTGLIESRVSSNGFIERGGCPWDKGWIEAYFAKLWNILAGEKGYKGSNERLNGPGSMEDMKLAAARLLGRGARKLNLPDEVLAQLHHPFPSVAELEAALEWAMGLVETRTDHRYIGFKTINEYVIEEGTDPVPFSGLSGLPPEVLQAAEVVERRESVQERWTELTSRVVFTPIPTSVLAVLCLEPRIVEWRNHAFSFDAEKTSYKFSDNKEEIMSDVQEGTKFLTYIDLKNPEFLHVATMAGAFVGTLKRLCGPKGAVDLRDPEAIGKWSGYTRNLVEREKAKLAVRHADLIAQQAADAAHNKAIVEAYQAETKGLTNAEKIQAASSEAQAEAFLARKRVTQAVKPVSAQAAGKALASFVNDEADVSDFHQIEDPQPVRSDDSEDSISLNDL